MEVTHDAGQNTVKRPWVEGRWAFYFCLVPPLGVAVVWALFALGVPYGSLEATAGGLWLVGLLACGWSLGEIVWCCINQKGHWAWVWALVLVCDFLALAGGFGFFVMEMD